MPETSKFQLTPPIAILASGVLIAGAILFTNYYTPQQIAAPAEATGAAAALSIRPPAQDDHWFGSRDADIVLVEYSDFECPYCSMINPTLTRLVEESQGTVAWAYRHFPLESIHPQALSSAIASECIAEQLGNDGFWAFAEDAFENQRSLGSTYYAQAAVRLGAEPAAFAACVASGKHEQKIIDDYNEAVEQGGRGTPFTVVTDGEVQAALSGAVPYATMKSVIEALKARQQ